MRRSTRSGTASTAPAGSPAGRCSFVVDDQTSPQVAVQLTNAVIAHMTGDGFLLAAEVGATLRDMEMVQFFPIAHLYPPLVQLDPIMWDPFRYKLGGRLLANVQRAMAPLVQSGDSRTPRDTATYKIFQEVEEGRGSPHGGVYLDFRMIAPEALTAGFGPVIDILARQGIDLTRDMVEVSPMAHFMLGGIVVDAQPCRPLIYWASRRRCAASAAATPFPATRSPRHSSSGRIAGEIATTVALPARSADSLAQGSLRCGHSGIHAPCTR